MAGVFKSTDFGASWVRMTAGIPRDSNLIIGAVGVSPANSNLVLAATQAGYIYRSTDAALTWTASSNGITPVTSVSVGGWAGRAREITTVNCMWSNIDCGVTPG